MEQEKAKEFSGKEKEEFDKMEQERKQIAKERLRTAIKLIESQVGLTRGTKGDKIASLFEDMVENVKLHEFDSALNKFEKGP